MKPFRVVSVHEGMPEINESVLIYVEGDWRNVPAGWTVGYFNGNSWVYEVPAAVFSHVEQYTGHNIPMGEDLVSPDFGSSVTHWAALPASPEDVLFKKVSENKSLLVPQVRRDTATRTVEIFGPPSPYVEESPYYIDDPKSAEGALLTLARVATKNWARSEKFLRKLARALADSLPLNEQLH